MSKGIAIIFMILGHSIQISYGNSDGFFDNIVFTYAFRPQDNLLGKVLKETQVNEEDAVCLGLYHLRAVLSLRKKDKRI